MGLNLFWIGIMIVGIVAVLVEIFCVIGQKTEGSACQVDTYQVCTLTVHHW